MRGKGCLFLLGFVVFMAFATATSVSAVFALREADPATRALRAEQAQHEAAMNRIREAEAASAADRAATFWSGVLDAAVIGARIVLAGAPLAALAVLALFVVGRYTHTRAFVEVEGVPVSRQLAMQGATVPMALMQVELYGQAAIAAAQNPRLDVPRDLRHLSVKYGNQAAPRVLPTPPAAPALGRPPEKPAATPSLVDVARLARPDEVVLGLLPSGQPRSMGLDALGATLIVGERGSGKSTTLAALAGLCALNLRAALFVVDRHARLRDSFTQRIGPLASSLAYPVGVSAADIGSILTVFETELEERLAGRSGGACVLVVDEVTDLYLDPTMSEIGERLGVLSQRLAAAGRKMDLGIMAAAQLSDRDSLGGHFAYAASTFVAHRCTPDLVRRFLGREAARPLLTLANGEVVARCQGAIERLRVPYATSADFEQISHLTRRLGSGASDSASWGGAQPAQPVQPPTGATTESVVVDETTARRNRIRDLAALGYSRNKISYTVYGHKDDGTMDEIRAVLGPAE